MADGNGAILLLILSRADGVTLHIDELRLSALRVNFRFGNPMDPVSATLHAASNVPIILKPPRRVKDTAPYRPSGSRGIAGKTPNVGRDDPARPCCAVDRRQRT